MNIGEKMIKGLKFLVLMNSLMLILIVGGGCGGGGGSDSDENGGENNQGITSECELNDQICDGTGYKVCEDSDSDGIAEWSEVTPCTGGETCSNGECSIQCVDECSAGDRECLVNGNGYRVCGQNDADSCQDWVTVNCETDETCSDGECRTVINVLPGIDGAIGDAVDSAGPNDIINIPAGDYKENFVITESITLQGAGPDKTFIQGVWNVQSPVIAVSPDDPNDTAGKKVTIRGLMIKEGKDMGISVQSLPVVLENLVIHSNMKDGIHLDKAEADISNCRITGNSVNGIYSNNNSHLKIFNCIINDNTSDGIALNTSTAEIGYTTLHANKSGINAYDSVATIKNSIISENNSPGILEDASTLTLSYLNFYWNGILGCEWKKNDACISDDPAYTLINSIRTDPQFAIAGHDYHLKDGSKALTASKSGGEIGAYGNGGNPPN